MIRNYLKVALRNLRKNKGFSLINIIGLSVGLATCILILLFVQDELNYDRYNKNAGRVYRTDADIQFGGAHFILAVSPPQLSSVMLKEYPQVEAAVRFRDYGGFLVRKGNENIQENRVIYADSSLFSVFTLPMIAGNANNALSDPKSIVVTRDIAMKYFNRTDVVGQNFTINDTGNYKITGVIENVPRQSHFNYDFFVSLSQSPEAKQDNWLSNNFNTYVLLKPGVDGKKFESHLDEIVNKYVFPQAQQMLNVSKENMLKSGTHVYYSLTPLTQIHLHSNKVAELSANSDIRYVYIFSIIAVLILIIACVNFMNLSTARSVNRAKEVGIRKVAGSLRSNLIFQFLTESTLISFFSLLLALVIVLLLLPYFNQLSGKEISIGSVSISRVVPLLLALVLIVGLLAGSYPAFFLSRFKPIEVLKGKFSSGFKGSWLRSSLVVFQFATSIILIVGTIVIYNQLNYIRNKNLGYNREQVLVIQNCYPLGKQAKTFEAELLKLAGVQRATLTGYLPTGSYRSDSPLFEDPTLDQHKSVSMQNWLVDENYIPTLGMQMVKGRNFSSQFATDSDAIIINESAAKLLSFKDPINQKLYLLKNLQTKAVSAYNIIGVVKDFNFNSLREQVTPMVLFDREEHGSIALRINTSNIPGLIRQVQDKWKTMAPGQPFAYSFMNDDFNNTYLSEQRIGKIFVSFAILAILIGCLGLFGLVTYAAEQRTKEIGIRKVLGATVSNIVALLSKYFIRLVIVAAIIAFPIAWFGMNKWLQDYSYRVSIDWWTFAVAAIIIITISMITVSFHAIKAAIANPVKSLRTE
ncbi:MAG: ABC transporter permease [Chitinophagales bacterium]|nr:ABC transporter permease [Chitinophagales bacterium]